MPLKSNQILYMPSDYEVNVAFNVFYLHMMRQTLHI